MATEGRAAGTLGTASAVAAKGEAAVEGPTAEGAWCVGPGRGSGALAHPRPKRVSSSCLLHRRAYGRAT